MLQGHIQRDGKKWTTIGKKYKFHLFLKFWVSQYSDTENKVLWRTMRRYTVILVNMYFNESIFSVHGNENINGLAKIPCTCMCEYFLNVTVYSGPSDFRPLHHVHCHHIYTCMLIFSILPSIHFKTNYTCLRHFLKMQGKLFAVSALLLQVSDLQIGSDCTFSSWYHVYYLFMIEFIQRSHQRNSGSVFSQLDIIYIKMILFIVSLLWYRLIIGISTRWGYTPCYGGRQATRWVFTESLGPR